MLIGASSRLKSGVVVGILAGLCAYAAWSHGSMAAGPPEKEPSLDVLFSPDGGCQDRIIAEIKKAKKRIRVQMYMFTSKEIADALADAKKHGVDCEIMVDKSQEKMTYGRLPVLNRAGVSLLVDAEHEIANNKIMLIDDDVILTGSYNYTKAAEDKNAENLLIIKGHAEVFARYSANYDAHKAHSRAYERP